MTQKLVQSSGFLLWWTLPVLYMYLRVPVFFINKRTERHKEYIYIYIYIYIYTGCPRRNVPEFGRVFLMIKYSDITQNTYVQSWMVTEIMAREVWSSGGSTHCTCQLTSLIDVYPWVWCPITGSQLTLSYSRFRPECAVSHVTSVLAIHVSCIVLGTLRTTMTCVRVFFLVQFNGFMSLTS